MTDATPTYDYAGRVQRARALMKKNNLDGLYIVAGPEMVYFTGYTAYQGGWPVWLSALILPAEAEPVLLISDMHASIYQAKGGSWVTDVRTYRDGADPTGLLADIFRESGIAGGQIGVQDSTWFGDSERIQAAAPGTGLVVAVVGLTASGAPSGTQTIGISCRCGGALGAYGAEDDVAVDLSTYPTWGLFDASSATLTCAGVCEPLAALHVRARVKTDGGPATYFLRLRPKIATLP